MLRDADTQLAAAWRKLDELVMVADLSIKERMFIASRAQVEISETRRVIGDVLNLKE